MMAVGKTQRWEGNIDAHLEDGHTIGPGGTESSLAGMPVLGKLESLINEVIELGRSQHC